MAILLIALTLFLLYVLSSSWSLFRNYQAARKSGLPIIILPYDIDSLFWNVFGVTFHKSLERYLPKSVYARINMSIFGWQVRSDVQDVHSTFGSSWIYVTPAKNVVWTADLELASAILARRKEFIALEMTTYLIGMFGPSIMTTNGNDWERHRRLVAPLLNERVSATMWHTAVEQARGWVNHELQKNHHDPTSPSTMDSIRQVTFNCLQIAVYGISRPWTPKAEVYAAPVGHEMSFQETLKTISDYFIPVAFLPAKYATLDFMPETIRKLGIAKNEFLSHVYELIAQRRKTMESQEYTADTPNLLDFVVKSSDDEKQQAGKGGILHLREDEITGNAFQFTVAGYETSANTLSYALALLTLHPEIQDWLHEEIKQAHQGDDKSISTIDYEALYPKLPRCLAVMHETLRLYPPILALSRTSFSPAPISTIHSTSSSGFYQIPIGANVFINSCAFHTSPEIWGEDAHVFRPSRWISKDTAEREVVEFPKEKFGFLAWSGGPRACPGMKMSQVEFVGIMVEILGRCRIIPAIAGTTASTEDGKGDGEEEMESEKERLRDVIKDSQPTITLQMKRPGDLKLRFVPR